jgi:plastocyanin
MKKDSEKKDNESHGKSVQKAEDLAKDLKESEAEVQKDNKQNKETNIGTTIVVLIILAILVVIVGFIIKSNIQTTIQSNNLTNVLSQINSESVVDINRLGFIPTLIQIKKGDSVIWKNQNYSSHQIVFDTGNINSFEIDKLGNYSITFNEAGIYEYHSATQIYMRGKIEVS